MPARIPANVREQQIDSLHNISFVRWDGEFKSNKSYAVVRCRSDGFEWRASVHNLVNNGHKCPECSNVRKWTAEEQIKRINSMPNVAFVSWVGPYTGVRTKAICRCAVDGFEWSASVNSLMKGHSCPNCAGNRRWTPEEREAQINAISGIEFVGWEGPYIGKNSKAICQCTVDGSQWVSTVNNLINHSNGCPTCAEYGFNKSKPATLYVLKSACGSMAKIGISNDYKTRLNALKRATPFPWHILHLIHGSGERVAEAEKLIHSRTEQALSGEKFDGFTEWREWSAHASHLISMARKIIEAP